MKIEKQNLIVGGRILFALVILAFGYAHLTNASSMVPLVPSYLPLPYSWVYLTGICLVLAGVSIMINEAAWAAGTYLAIYLGIVIVTVHMPALSKDPMAMVSILKDLGIAAGALIIAGLDSTFDHEDGEPKEKKRVEPRKELKKKK